MPTCPQCDMWLVRQSPRQGVVENLLRCLAIGPLRCQLCTHRFLGILWRVNHITEREYERIPVQYPVYFRLTFAKEDTQPSLGTVSALSIKGCTISTRVSVQKGDCLCLQLEPTDQESPIQIDGARVRTVHETKIGVLFTNIRPDEETRLRRHMMFLLQTHLPNG